MSQYFLAENDLKKYDLKSRHLKKNHNNLITFGLYINVRDEETRRVKNDVSISGEQKENQERKHSSTLP